MELDERAVEIAAKAIYDHGRGEKVLHEGTLESIPFEEATFRGVFLDWSRQAITAYLAACPTPDAEAWQPMDDDALQAMTARIRNGEADEDEQARFSMTNMMFIIHQWASGAVDATSQQAYAAALLHHAESVNALYRKAVSR